jgi:hypothetical protein
MFDAMVVVVSLSAAMAELIGAVALSPGSAAPRPTCRHAKPSFTRLSPFERLSPRISIDVAIMQSTRFQSAVLWDLFADSTREANTGAFFPKYGPHG